MVGLAGLLGQVGRCRVVRIAKHRLRNKGLQETIGHVAKMPNNAITGVQKRRFALLLHACYGERWTDANAPSNVWNEVGSAALRNLFQTLGSLMRKIK